MAESSSDVLGEEEERTWASTAAAGVAGTGKVAGSGLTCDLDPDSVDKAKVPTESDDIVQLEGFEDQIPFEDLKSYG